MGIFALLKKIVRNKSELKNLFLIKKSKYFNKKWYLNTYPDVKKAKIDPAIHYLKYGWKEYRDPSPLFSTTQYLIQNKDVASKGINPLVHFEKYGKKENRKIFYNGQSSSYLALSTKEKTYYDIISNSRMFNKEWYLKYYYWVNEDPIIHYIKNYYNYKPSPVFYSQEYLAMHLDVSAHNINPLVHFEQNGKYEGRAVSFADIRGYSAPSGTKEVTKEISMRDKAYKKIVTVLAMFSSNGKIEEYQLYLLKGLKKISDYIIVVADNPVYEEELQKLDGLCNAYRFIRHGEYDFGSYKYGYNYLLEHNILKEDDNLLFINDSNYGPVYPFENVINDFKSKQCDFYGLTVGSMFKEHIQSFFYIFKSKVFLSNIFRDFIQNIKQQLSPLCVIVAYEVELTSYLCKHGFTYNVFINKNILKENYKVPSKYSYTLISDYAYPLLKKKSIQGFDNENIEMTLKIIQANNPDLYNIIIDSNDYKKKKVAREVYIPSKYNIYTNYNKKLAEIQEKYINGEKINIAFLVNMTSMFPAEKLMLLMKDDNIYNVKLYVIPDIRFGNKEMYRIYNETFNELTSKYNYVEHSVEFDSEKEEIIEYKNIIKDADIVCYPSPYDLSFSIYNPFYAVQENILSIHINYGFFRSIYDRFIYSIYNYNNFWKIFLETDINYNEYRLYGQCEAKNSVVVGYAKMDRLQKYIENKKQNKRKQIIIAPHHSVDGGANKALSLSNFEKYADLFLELPLKYPEIDFIFRPHPVLFTVLKGANYWGEEKVKKYLDKFTSYDNAIYSTEGDYLEIFANSDGIIQDSGSFLVEYFYTGKPCCYMLKSEKDIQDKFNELGIKCLEHTYIAYSENEIINFIENIIIKENDYMEKDRISFAQDEIMLNYPNVTKFIYDKLLRMIKNKGVYE